MIQGLTVGILVGVTLKPSYATGSDCRNPGGSDTEYHPMLQGLTIGILVDLTLEPSYSPMLQGLTVGILV